MKAVVYTEYGSPDVLQLKEVEKPTPKDNEIRIRVYATPVNYGDVLARNFKNIYKHEFNMPSFLLPPTRLELGFNKPRKQILGAEFAGEVEAIGKDVSRFKVGDSVFGYLGAKFSANAEYLCMPETGIVALKPSNMTYAEAANIPYGALTALNLLRKAGIQAGQKVLINGASGGIGSGAVQLAKHYGAEVTGVCGTPRLEFVRALGADHVIDYTRADFTQNGQRYDLIFDILGKDWSWARYKNSLSPNGRYLLASFKTKQLLHMFRTSVLGIGNQKVICALSMEKQADLVQVKELAEAGKLKSIIDRCYPLEQAAEAHRYFESGQKKGSIIITIGV